LPQLFSEHAPACFAGRSPCFPWLKFFIK
jgi:hypothetical protein